MTRSVQDRFAVKWFYRKGSAINRRRGYGRDSGNDFSFPVPSPFLKLNDNYKSFLSGYPMF